MLAGVATTRYKKVGAYRRSMPRLRRRIQTSLYRLFRCKGRLTFQADLVRHCYWCCWCFSRRDEYRATGRLK